MCSYNSQLSHLYELARRHSGLITKTENQTLLGSGVASEGFGGAVTTILGGDLPQLCKNKSALQSQPNACILRSTLL